MTILHFNNNVTRETCSYYRQRALVVTLKPQHVEIRQKGRRDVLSVDYATLYEFSQKLRWRREQAEKKQAKGGQKGKRHAS